MTKVAKTEELKTPLPSPDEKSMLMLSEVCQNHLINDQRSDVFIKNFKEAIRNSEFRAIIYKERFTQPKVFRKRNSKETAQKQARDYIIENSQEFQDWFNEQNHELSANREGKTPINIDTVSAGLVDFDALFADTQATLQRSFEKGRKLGTTYGRENGRKLQQKEEPEVNQAAAKATTAKKGKKTAPVAADDDENSDLL